MNNVEPQVEVGGNHNRGRCVARRAGSVGAQLGLSRHGRNV